MHSDAPQVTWEHDGPPIVRMLGASLRRTMADPRVAGRMGRLRGRVALRSTVGPQAATIEVERGSIHVTGGVAAGAGVVVAADLDTMGRPGAAKPEVRGALRHPRLALGMSRALAGPRPGEWPAAVDALWDWSRLDAARPQGLRVVCTDDGREHVVGPPGAPQLEVHGPAWALLAVFTGADHLGAALIEGRVQAVGDLPALSRFVGVATRFMLGEDGAA
jgi:hypothetical protein